MLRWMLVLVMCAWCGLGLQARAEELPAKPEGFESAEAVHAAFKSGQIRPITPPQAWPEGVEEVFNVEYARPDGQPLMMDLCLPRGEPAAGRPAVLLFHGGAWRAGERTAMRFYLVWLAQQGFVTATASYRLIDRAPFPAAVDDARAALRFLRKHAADYGIDPESIAVWGNSAGAHLAMMVGFLPERPPWWKADRPDPEVSGKPAAVVAFYGPTEMTSLLGQESHLVRDFLGGLEYEQNPLRYAEVSPYIYASPDDPPTMLLHGTVDRIVPVRQARIMAEKLENVGVPCELEILEGWPHTMDLAEPVNAYCRPRIVRFLEAHLKAAGSR